MSKPMSYTADLDRPGNGGRCVLLSQGETRPGIVQGQHWGPQPSSPIGPPPPPPDGDWNVDVRI